MIAGFVGLLLVVLMAGAPPSFALELPGTTTLPLPLRNPYEDAGSPPIPPRTPLEAAVPRRERPWLILVPDIRFVVGYSDNIFITPDVFGLRPVSDGIVSLSPRLRALVRLSHELGLIGDYNFGLQQYFAHGHAIQNSGTLFLGYRPSIANHAELGVRGGTASVSEFADSNFHEGHGYLSGGYGLTPDLSLAASGSIGIREFPDRTRTDSRALLLGIGPLVLPVPIGTVVTTRKGQQDVVGNVAGGISFTYSRTGALRAAYDFTNDNSDFSGLDYQSHRLSFGNANVWTSWLNTQLGYSASFRRFIHAASEVDAIERDDTLHDFTVTLNLTPKLLRDFWFTRSGTIHVDYDLLLDRSNLAGADFDRNFFSVGIDIGLIPITSDEIGRLLFPGLYGMPRSVSVSSEMTP